MPPPQPPTAAQPQPRPYLTTTQKKILIRLLEGIIIFVTNFILVYYLKTLGILIVKALDELRRYYGDISLSDFLDPATRPDLREHPPDVTFTLSEIPATTTSADLPEVPPNITFTAMAMPGERDCYICLESFVEGDLCRRLGACKHVFHSDCVNMWLARKRTCPVCRMTVDSAAVRRLKKFFNRMR